MGLNRSDRYRKRAEELRAIAATMLDQQTKQVMLDTAVRFEQIAESGRYLGPQSPLFRDL